MYRSLSTKKGREVPEETFGLVGNETSENWKLRIRNHDMNINQSDYNKLPKTPISLLLDNLRSAFNVGSIFRTADTARLREVITTGFTCHPPHNKLEKTALGTADVVPHRHFDKTCTAVKKLQIVLDKTNCFEKDSNPNPNPNPNSTQYNGIALIVGNEVKGVDPDVLKICDKIIEIPMLGFKNSLNVASCVSIVTFEILRQFQHSQNSNEIKHDLSPVALVGKCDSTIDSKNLGKVVSIPFMITKAMREKMFILGYSSKEISALKPLEVHDILKANEKK
eukprot:GSMAST32.ASY1.ANO1.1743.1 assembled CDS